MKSLKASVLTMGFGLGLLFFAQSSIADNSCDVDCTSPSGGESSCSITCPGDQGAMCYCSAEGEAICGCDDSIDLFLQHLTKSPTPE